MRELLLTVIPYGNNGYARCYGRDGAQQVLTEIRQKGLLDHDFVISTARRSRHVRPPPGRHLDDDRQDGAGRDRSRSAPHVAATQVRHVRASQMRPRE